MDREAEVMSGGKPFLPSQLFILSSTWQGTSPLMDAQHPCSYWHETGLERNLGVFPFLFYCYPNRKSLLM